MFNLILHFLYFFFFLKKDKQSQWPLCWGTHYPWRHNSDKCLCVFETTSIILYLSTLAGNGLVTVVNLNESNLISFWTNCVIFFLFFCQIFFKISDTFQFHIFLMFYPFLYSTSLVSSCFFKICICIPIKSCLSTITLSGGDKPFSWLAVCKILQWLAYKYFALPYFYLYEPCILWF